MRIEFKTKGYRQVRTSDRVTAECKRSAEPIAARANQSSGDGGYKVGVQKGRNRSRATVITTTGKSIRDNARNNTLIRSMRNE